MIAKRLLVKCWPTCSSNVGIHSIVALSSNVISLHAYHSSVWHLQASEVTESCQARTTGNNGMEANQSQLVERGERCLFAQQLGTPVDVGQSGRRRHFEV